MADRYVAARQGNCKRRLGKLRTAFVLCRVLFGACVQTGIEVALAVAEYAISKANSRRSFTGSTITFPCRNCDTPIRSSVDGGKNGIRWKSGKSCKTFEPIMRKLVSGAHRRCPVAVDGLYLRMTAPPREKCKTSSSIFFDLYVS
jgi:hypothetical protein